jgi:serine/threonine-protein kinase
MLFNEAKRLAAAGKYADACPKFEESQRLDPAIGTQFNLADCEEHIGRTASAWAAFQDVAAASKTAGQSARAQVASRRAAALEPRLSKLTIVAPKDVIGLEVRRNGELLGSILWGNAIPVDPGTYTIDASAPGKKKWSTVTTVGPDGATVSVSIPPLEAVDEAVRGTAPDAAPAQAVPVTPGEGSGDGDHPGSTQRTLALVAGGVGVAALGTGAFFGVRSLSKHSEYVSHCNGSLCDAAGVAAHDDAVSAGNLSTIAFAVGGALVVGGAVLWLTAPSASTGDVKVAPVVGPGTMGVSIAGGWR